MTHIWKGAYQSAVAHSATLQPVLLDYWGPIGQVLVKHLSSARIQLECDCNWGNSPFDPTGCRVVTHWGQGESNMRLKIAHRMRFGSLSVHQRKSRLRCKCHFILGPPFNAEEMFIAHSRVNTEQQWKVLLSMRQSLKKDHFGSFRFLLKVFLLHLGFTTTA